MMDSYGGLPRISGSIQAMVQTIAAYNALFIDFNQAFKIFLLHYVITYNYVIKGENVSETGLKLQMHRKNENTSTAQCNASISTIKSLRILNLNLVRTRSTHSTCTHSSSKMRQIRISMIHRMSGSILYVRNRCWILADRPTRSQLQFLLSGIIF